MTSNLLLGYPEIPALATITLSTGTEDSAHPVKNIISGSRALYFQWSADQTTPTINFDLGASLTKAVDYFFVAGANLLVNDSTTALFLQSSPDNAVWTSRLGTAAALTTRTFGGLNDEDVLFTSTLNSDTGTPTSTAFRYWRYQPGGSAGKRPHRKAFFGSFFDFGYDPIYPATISRAKNAPGERTPSLRFELEWRGVTNSKVTTFRTEMYKKRDVYPVLLYASSYDYMINNQVTVLARIVEGSFEPESYNSNRVRIVFQELV